MIKKLQLILLLVFASMTMVAQDWIEVNSGLPNGKGIGQISVGMNDATALWAMPINADGTIYDAFTKSTDGGLTWTAGTFNAGTGLSQIFAIDANTCWAVFNTGATQGLYKTVNGGTTWVKKGGVFNNASFANVIHFFNDNDGFAQGDPVGGYYELYTTTNGGETWTRVPQASIPAPTAGEYGITGNYSAFGNSLWWGTNKGRVYYSADKGFTWQVSVLPFGTANVVQPLFRNETTGIAFRSYLNMGVEPELNVSTNGGASWSSLFVTGNMYARWFDYIPGSAGILLGSSSAPGFEGISYSFDDGATWTDLTVGVPVQSPKFIDNQTGWAGTWVVNNSGGILIYTGDPIGGGSIIHEDFESYTTGGKLVQQAVAQGKEYWATWSGATGGAEDPTIMSNLSVSGSNSVVIAGTNDVVMHLGNKTAGAFSIEFNVLIPTGRIGYFNLLQVFAGNNSEWGMQAFFRPNGAGTVDAGAENAGLFSYAYNTWIPVKCDVDLNNDFAELFINGNSVITWTWSGGTFGTGTLNQLGALNLYAWNVGGTPQAYYDDIVYTQTAPAAGNPVIGVTPATLSETLNSGQTSSKSLTIANTGVTALNYNILVSYVTSLDASSGGHATRSTAEEAAALNAITLSGDDFSSIQTSSTAVAPKGTDAVVVLNYDGENFSAVGLTNGGTYEVAAKFPANMVGSYIGMELTEVQVYINDPAEGYKLKIYGQDLPNRPGLLLYQQTFAGTPFSWNTIVLNTPLMNSGGDLWVAYEVTQVTVGIFPAGTDAGPAHPEGDWIKTGASWAKLSAISTLNYNWNIRAKLVGDPIQAWLSVNPASGTVEPGATQVVTVNFNAAGLIPGNYQASINISSNDPANPSVTVPVSLVVGGTPPPTPTVVAALDFESVPDFSLTFAPWTVNDVDQLPTYGFTGTTFPNAYQPMAFIAFNPSLTVPPMTGDAQIQPHGGVRFGASFASTTAPWNNDWLISPQVALGTQSKLKLWVKSYTAEWGLERYKIGVSTTGNLPANFTIISQGAYLQAPTTWTEMIFDLSGYDNQTVYVGIQCVSQDAFIFMVDDIQITSIIGVSTPEMDETSFVIYPNPAKDLALIKGQTEMKQIRIMNLTGQIVYERLVSGTDASINTTLLSSGLYFVQIETANGWNTQKLMID